MCCQRHQKGVDSCNLDPFVLKWTIKWLLGLYGFGIRPVWKILTNKIDFFKFQTKYAREISAQILSIGTLKSYRGKSIGTKLVEAGLEFLKSKGVKEVKLEVRPDNLPAIKLYKNLDSIKLECRKTLKASGLS